MSSLPGPPTSVGQPSRGLVAFLLVLACVPYALGLGEPPLWDANEPLYAEPPREVLELGTRDAFLAPPWNYSNWFVRPPLVSWLTLPSYALFGVTPFAARLPMALAAMATILATYALARALYDRRAGCLAALVLAATPRFWTCAREFAGDIDQTAILTWAYALAVPTLRGARGARTQLRVAHALVAVGCLVKGPSILALWLVPLLLAARLTRPRIPWRALLPWSLGAAVLLLAAPWFVYMCLRFGWDYPRVFFGHHHLQRMFTDEVGSRDMLYYGKVLLAEAQPWLFLAPFAVVRWWRARSQESAAWLVWAGVVVPIVLFSIPHGKRNVYLMPVYPCLAVGLAPFLAEVWDGARRGLARIFAGVMTLALTGLCLIIGFSFAHLPSELGWGLVVVASPLVVGLLPFDVLAWRGHGRWVVGLLLAGMLVVEGMAGLFLARLSPYRPVPALCEALRPRLAPGEPVIIYAVALHSPMFYLRRGTSVAGDPESLAAQLPAGHSGWLLTPEDELALLRARIAAGTTPHLDLEEIERAPYLRLNWRSAVLGAEPCTRNLLLVRAVRPP